MKKECVSQEAFAGSGLLRRCPHIWLMKEKVPSHNIPLYLNVGDFCQMRRFDFEGARKFKLTERKFDLEQ